MADERKPHEEGDGRANGALLSSVLAQLGGPLAGTLMGAPAFMKGAPLDGAVYARLLEEARRSGSSIQSPAQVRVGNFLESSEFVPTGRTRSLGAAMLDNLKASFARPGGVVRIPDNAPLYAFPGAIKKEELSGLARMASSDAAKYKEYMDHADRMSKGSHVFLDRGSSAEVLAHELGHSTQKFTPLHNASRRLSPLALMGAGVVSGMNDDPLYGVVANTAASAGFAPVLWNELQASYRGSKMLKAVGAGSRFKAFMGVPSYFGAMVAPWASLGLYQRLRRPAPGVSEGRVKGLTGAQLALGGGVAGLGALAALAVLLKNGTTNKGDRR